MSARPTTPPSHPSDACQIDPTAAPQSPSSVERLLVALAALCALLTPFLFDFDGAGGVGNDLVGDGRVIVTQHPVHSALASSPSALLHAFTVDWFAQLQPGTQLYRPVPTFLVGLAALVASSGQDFVYSLDQPGSSALPFKFVAVSLKIVCALLVLELALALTHKRRVALLAGLLFAVLPVHGAAVFDIAGVATTSATAFMLGAWVLWLRAGDAPLAKPALLGGAALCTLLAALSMEIAFLLPLVILAADAGRSGAASLGAGLKRALAKGPALGALVLALLVALVLRFAVTGQILPEYLPGSEVENPLVAAGALTRVLDGLRLAIFGLPIVFGLNPFSTSHLGFSADYSAPQVALGNAFAVANIVGLVAWIALAVGAALWFKSCRTRGSLLLALLASLLAAAHLVAPAGDVFNERLLFFPSAIVCVIVAASVAPLVGRLGKVGLGAYGLVVVGLAALLVQRASTWSEEDTLWRVTSRESAKLSTRAHFNYGRELLRQESASSAASALELAIAPSADHPTKHSWARALLALAHVTNGEPQEAVAPLVEAIDIQIERAGGTWEPTKWDGFAREDRVDILLWQLTQLRAVDGIDPIGHLEYLDGLLARGYASPHVHLRRAETLRQLKRNDEAAAAYEAGVAIAPVFSLVRSYGDFLRARGEPERAFELYEDQLERLESQANSSVGQRQEFLLQKADLAYARGDAAAATALVEEVLSTNPAGALRFRALQTKANLILDVPPSGDNQLEVEIDKFTRYGEAVRLLTEAIYSYPYHDEYTQLAYQTYSTLLFEQRNFRATAQFLNMVIGQAETATLRLRLGESLFWIADESNWAPAPTNAALQSLTAAADQFRALALRASAEASLKDGDRAVLANMYASARLLELRATKRQGDLERYESALAEERVRAVNELGAAIVLAYIEIEQGRYAEAKVSLGTLAARDPLNAERWRWTAGELTTLESRLVEIGSSPTPEALVHCALIQFSVQDHAGALTAIAQAISLSAGNPSDLARSRLIASLFAAYTRGPAEALRLVEDALRDLGDTEPELKTQLELRRDVLNAMLGRPRVGTVQ
jgi:tetratricopeptide (TPR) repeat protein